MPTNFITDNTGLYADKVDLVPPAGAINHYVDASDMNLISAALKDIQAWLRGSGGGGVFQGLATNVSDPAPAGVTNYLWLKTDGTLWITIGGVASQVGATPKSPLLSTGLDGALVFDGSTTILGIVPSSNVYKLTRDLFASSITVNAGITIDTNNWAIYCTGTITGLNATTSIIHNGGGTPTNNVIVAAKAAARFNATLAGGAGVSGTGAGTAGAANPSNCPGAPWFTSQLAATAGTGAAGTSTVGGNGTGNGTGGGGGGCNNTGSGQTAGTGGALTVGASNLFGTSEQLAGRNFAGGTGWQFGTGGGGGSASVGTGTNVIGGAGGGGGGLCVVLAQAVTTITIHANGGNGAPGQNGVSTVGAAGGGGGGGGGFLVVGARTIDVSVTLTANGGTGGAGFAIGSGASGKAGGNGTAGRVVQLSL